ncbi:hypothetical protein [uncultured Thiothrix sp.]|uniref:hypothetical protein n=1 Tax=uncultured Thiothrix sp. TaxID=223185 RepID=UPI0026286FC7|nr:hypothetical protein [uncultured Thiothrix sp.]
MKYFFPILMGIVILFGMGLTLTPYIADWFLPVSASNYQQAKPADARQAVADWFGVKPEDIKAAQAIRRRTNEGNTSWLMFEASREPVAQFVLNARLQQVNLDQTALQAIWLNNPPPMDWWQPVELKRETYFSGKTENRILSLVYNEEQQKGYLIVKAIETVNDKTKNSF